MKRPVKMAVSALLLLAGVVALYFGGIMLYGTLTDYKPADKETVKINNAVTAAPADSAFSFLIWNIGYAGLGDKEDFFFDGGKMVRPSKERVDENLKGIATTLAAQADVDFILLQEVDVRSKRSHYTNQVEAIARVLPGHANGYAQNFVVDHVPSPLHKPWDALGKVDAGLASYSRFQPVEATRIALPGGFGWPKRVFWLDRCLLLYRYNLTSGKQLVVINTHNEAYDEGGKIKAKEMALLKELLLSEYGKGNYVVVGGDWNQCPPNFDYQHFGKDEDNSYVQLNIDKDFLPADWTWAFDPNTPTNRKLATTYEPGSTFVTLIDFFLVSPNLTVEKVEGINMGFKNSDHQAVKMRVVVK
jgi:endonuclease/exonuclease/phosphatase family metal-dependent hydrolase